MTAALNLLEQYSNEGEDMLNRIVTSDETWIHHFTPEMKKMSMILKRLDEPAPKKFETTLSAGKVMCTVFWDSRGVILQEYLSRGETINAVRYCETLKKLREAIKK